MFLTLTELDGDKEVEAGTPRRMDVFLEVEEYRLEDVDGRERRVVNSGDGEKGFIWCRRRKEQG